MSLVRLVKQSIDSECLDTKCSKEGCALSLDGLQEPFLLIDMDHEKAPTGSQGEKKCDYIFIGEVGAWLAPMELKRGKLRASRVVRQLQAGAVAAERLVPIREQTAFCPIAAYGGKAHRNEIATLRNSSIRFRSKKVGIVLVKCGSSLANALSKA